MTWTIWINFLPLSHGGSTWNLASIGPVVSEKIFEHTHTRTHTHKHTHTHTHTHTHILQYYRQIDIHTYTREPSALNCTCILAHQNTTTDSCSRWKMGGGGGRTGFEAKHYILCGGGGWRGCCCCFLFFFQFFNPVGGWLLWKCIIFCRSWSFSKIQFCGYPLFKWDLLKWKKKKKHKKKTKKNYEQTKSRFSREVMSWRIHCTISWKKKKKKKLKPRLFLPAIFAGLIGG